MTSLPRILAALVPLAAVACSVTPLSRKFEIGDDPLVVFTAEHRGSAVDLFAVTPSGGDPVQFTFTTLRESLPRLSSRGDVVAFVRDRGDQPGEDLVVMNLFNGAERVLELPPEAGTIESIGWSRDDTAIYVQTVAARWRVSAPPAAAEVQLLHGGDVAADSALMVLLGEPVFARAAGCEGGGVCVIGPSGESSQLHPAGAAPFRWGSDGIGWINNGRIEMRSLGPGAPQLVEWRDTTIRAIEATYAPS